MNDYIFSWLINFFFFFWNGTDWFMFVYPWIANNFQQQREMFTTFERKFLYTMKMLRFFIEPFFLLFVKFQWLVKFYFVAPQQKIYTVSTEIDVSLVRHSPDEINKQKREKVFNNITYNVFTCSDMHVLYIYI